MQNNFFENNNKSYSYKEIDKNLSHHIENFPEFYNTPFINTNSNRIYKPSIIKKRKFIKQIDKEVFNHISKFYKLNKLLCRDHLLENGSADISGFQSCYIFNCPGFYKRNKDKCFEYSVDIDDTNDVIRKNFSVGTHVLYKLFHLCKKCYNPRHICKHKFSICNLTCYITSPNRKEYINIKYNNCTEQEIKDYKDKYFKKVATNLIVLTFILIYYTVVILSFCFVLSRFYFLYLLLF